MPKQDLIVVLSVPGTQVQWFSVIIRDHRGLNVSWPIK